MATATTGRHERRRRGHIETAWTRRAFALWRVNAPNSLGGTAYSELNATLMIEMMTNTTASTMVALNSVFSTPRLVR